MALADKMIFQVKEAWIKVAKCLGIKKTGIGKLRQDVRTCDYEDVHILWELLKKNDVRLDTSTPRRRKGFSGLVQRVKRARLLSRHGG